VIRTQLLLNDEQNRKVRELASSEGKGISETIRAIIDEYFSWKESVERKEALEALAELDRIRARTLGAYEGDPVAEARKEREEAMEDVLWKQWS
jgi:hypothetical protein